MKKRWFFLALLLLAVGTIIGRTLFSPRVPPEIRYLPAETVVERIDTPATLAKLAAESKSLKALRLSYNKDTKELRDENGRLLKVVRRLSVDTGEVEESPEIASIICPDTKSDIPPIRRYYRASMEAWQFEGLVEHGGDNVYGWNGTINCEMRVDGSGWRPLVSKPFDLAQIVAQAVEPPRAAQRATRWYTGLHYALLLDTTRFDGPSQFSNFDPSRVRAYGGRRWFPKKRYSIRTGVFADSRAIGIDLGFDF